MDIITHVLKYQWCKQVLWCTHSVAYLQTALVFKYIFVYQHILQTILEISTKTIREWCLFTSLLRQKNITYSEKHPEHPLFDIDKNI